MLLPDRIFDWKAMHRTLSKEEKKLGIKRKPNFTELLDGIKKSDLYLLDEENAIVVVENPDRDSNYHYLMIHYRFVDGELQEVNRWEQRTHYYGPKLHKIKGEWNLFMVPDGRNIYHPGWDCCGSIYNYKTGEFVVEKGLYDVISATNHSVGSLYALPEIDYLKKYECFLAYFELRSEYQDDDIVNYTNPITNEDMAYGFQMSEIYFTFLNLDGTVRENKLFKGRSLSRITAIIDLEDYETLEQFKTIRREELTEEKNKRKQAYQERLITEQKDFISPYQDEEVIKVLGKRIK